MTAALVMAGCAKDDDGNRGNLPPLPDPTDVCSGMDDAVFKAYCIENFDKNGDGKVSKSEYEAVTEIDCNGLEIASFKGVEYFANLQKFSCNDNEKVAKIDLSHNAKIKAIGSHAFYDCTALTSVILPAGVTTIGNSSFALCTSLTEIAIPDSVAAIGDMAFCACEGLESVDIPENVVAIGNGVFVGCANLHTFRGKYASADGRCLIIDGELVAFAPAGLTTYAVPDGVASIADWSFNDCGTLTGITIADSVVSIGDYAFSECPQLASIAIPDNVTSVGDFVLSKCSGLKSVTLGSGIASIGDFAFNECTGLTSIEIPANVKTINMYAFYGCTALTSVTMGNGVATIGSNVFRKCTALTKVVLSDSVETIGDYAFGYCQALPTITIPAKVTLLGDYALYGCSGMSSIYCKPTSPPDLGRSVFNGIASDTVIYVPRASLEVYKNAIYYNGCSSEVVGYDF